jgi:hypothetical protein
MAEIFANVLVANGPRPELAREMNVFAPLIGSWDLTVYDHDEDGGETRSSAEWHFSWVLDGRAVADVWICPRRTDRYRDGDGEWGLSVRFYDPAIGAWRSTWHGPKRGWVIPFLAHATDDGIVLSGTRDGIALRWIFSDLTADSFRWRAEETTADGTTRVRQRFEATRAMAD